MSALSYAVKKLNQAGLPIVGAYRMVNTTTQKVTWFIIATPLASISLEDEFADLVDSVEIAVHGPAVSPTPTSQHFMNKVLGVFERHRAYVATLQPIDSATVIRQDGMPEPDPMTSDVIVEIYSSPSFAEQCFEQRISGKLPRHLVRQMVDRISLYAAA